MGCGSSGSQQEQLEYDGKQRMPPNYQSDLSNSSSYNELLQKANTIAAKFDLPATFRKFVEVQQYGSYNFLTVRLERLFREDRELFGKVLPLEFGQGLYFQVNLTDDILQFGDYKALNANNYLLVKGELTALKAAIQPEISCKAVYIIEEDVTPITTWQQTVTQVKINSETTYLPELNTGSYAIQVQSLETTRSALVKELKESGNFSSVTEANVNELAFNLTKYFGNDFYYENKLQRSHRFALQQVDYVNEIVQQTDKNQKSFSKLRNEFFELLGLQVSDYEKLVSQVTEQGIFNEFVLNNLSRQTETKVRIINNIDTIQNGTTNDQVQAELKKIFGDEEFKQLLNSIVDKRKPSQTLDVKVYGIPEYFINATFDRLYTSIQLQEENVNAIGQWKENPTAFKEYYTLLTDSYKQICDSTLLEQVGDQIKDGVGAAKEGLGNAANAIKGLF